ncbi:phospholipase D-like domain-containing protein [Roseicella frigidaeris]|uniref:Phospholipase D n=1 Tax=Roseicella frigidaeris TaxID=2230885 RepID=A0A327M4T4_9PROT|nr:phospholipase D-like domain-containing protein [Roseicella frigidaeris]RAI57233.1 cardiolipin synthase [Roseicella frigidaeris]
MTSPTTTFAATGLTLLHVTLSSLVTAHVLLRKREIGTAMGWIGLAWLSPFLGSALYYLLGINRVRRRARTLDRGEDAPQSAAPAPPPPGLDATLTAIDRTAWQISRRPALPGNDVTLLRCGDEAYPRMLAAIDGAARSIRLSSYILRDDAAGAPILDAVIRAQRRGVAARVLIDGIGGGYFLSPAYHRLRRNGVAAARFLHSPLPWNMPFLNLRSHKKILVVDDALGFAGGLNIGAENLLATDPAHPVRDTHFALRGPVVAQLASAFDADWHFATGAPMPAPPPMADAVPDGAATARVITSGPDQDLEKIEVVLLQAIACAQDSIRIMTPYFLPDERLITALALAAMRGVEVDIVVPERSNHRAVDWAMRAHVGPLLDAGCRIWLDAPPFDHTKLMVVDHAWSLVGSSNWDLRSLRLNFELDVEIYDAGTARLIAGLIEARRRRRLVGGMLAGRSLPARLRDAAMRLALPYI